MNKEQVSFAFPNAPSSGSGLRAQREMCVVQATSMIVSSYLAACAKMAKIEKEIMTSQGSPGGTTGFASELPNIRAHLLGPAETQDLTDKIKKAIDI